MFCKHHNTPAHGHLPHIILKVTVPLECHFFLPPHTLFNVKAKGRKSLESQWTSLFFRLQTISDMLHIPCI